MKKESDKYLPETGHQIHQNQSVYYGNKLNTIQIFLGACLGQLVPCTHHKLICVLAQFNGSTIKYTENTTSNSVLSHTHNTFGFGPFVHIGIIE